MGHSFRRTDGHERRQRHGRDSVPVGYLADDAHDDGRINASEISRQSGVGIAMILRFAKSGVLPEPVGHDERGFPLWDATDEKLMSWISALQRSGYNRRPAAV